MPFGTREKDNGEKIPATLFGIMGDPDAHKDLDKVNPMTPEQIEEATAAQDDSTESDDKDKDN